MRIASLLLVSFLWVQCPGQAAVKLHTAKWQTLIRRHPEVPLDKLFRATGTTQLESNWGNGVFVSPRHYLTANHVVASGKCEELEIRTLVSGRMLAGGSLSRARDGKRHQCVEVVVQDPVLDLALIEVSPPSAHYVPLDPRSFQSGRAYTSVSYLVQGYGSFVENIEMLARGSQSSACLAGEAGSMATCPGGTCPVPGQGNSNTASQSSPDLSHLFWPTGGYSARNSGTIRGDQAALRHALADSFSTPAPSSSASTTSPNANCTTGSCPTTGCATGSCAHASRQYGGYFDGFAEEGQSGSGLFRLEGKKIYLSGILSSVLSGTTETDVHGKTHEFMPDDFVRTPVHVISAAEFRAKFPEEAQSIQESVEEWEAHTEQGEEG